ncbi:MAG: HDOD domain-containing protein [bacterium]
MMSTSADHTALPEEDLPVEETTPPEEAPVPDNEDVSLDERVLTTGLLESIAGGLRLDQPLNLFQDIKRVVAFHPPSFPPMLRELAGITNEEMIRWSTLGTTVEQDESITRNLLEVINSPAVPVPTKVKSVSHAASLLTTPRLLDLTLLVAIQQTYDRPSLRRIPLLDPFDLIRHSALVSAIARLILNETSPKGTRPIQGSIAGILHDVGIYVLAKIMPQTYQAILQRQVNTNQTLLAMEREVLGCDHADVGAQFLSSLGFPPPIVDTVALHHLSVEKSPHRILAGVVALANRLAKHSKVAVIPQEPQDQMDLSVKDVVRDIKPEWARADVSTAIFVRYGAGINVRLDEIVSVLGSLTDQSDFVQEKKKPPVEVPDEIPQEVPTPPVDEILPAGESSPPPPIRRRVRRRIEFAHCLLPGLYLIQSDEPIEGILILTVFASSLVSLFLVAGEHIGATILLVAGVIGSAVWNILAMMRR